jgi:hypothetical protein
MGQITIYIDDATLRSVRSAAKAAGVSRSRWVADLIRRTRSSAWPPDVALLAGAWPDLPLSEDLRGLTSDVSREDL